MLNIFLGIQFIIHVPAVEITILGLKMMVKSCIESFYFETWRAPSEVCPEGLNCYGQFQNRVIAGVYLKYYSWRSAVETSI